LLIICGAKTLKLNSLKVLQLTTFFFDCFGFVDGTVRPISRPDERQRIVYNGHKRVHALKFQSLSLLNGLIGNLYGPVGEFFLKKILGIVMLTF